MTATQALSVKTEHLLYVYDMSLIFLILELKANKTVHIILCNVHTEERINTL